MENKFSFTFDIEARESIAICFKNDERKNKEMTFQGGFPEKGG